MGKGAKRAEMGKRANMAKRAKVHQMNLQAIWKKCKPFQKGFALVGGL